MPEIAYLDFDDASYICALRGHRSWATSRAFSPDGRRLVSDSHDKTIRIWGLST